MTLAAMYAKMRSPACLRDFLSARTSGGIGLPYKALRIVEASDHHLQPHGARCHRERPRIGTEVPTSRGTAIGVTKARWTCRSTRPT